MNQHVHPADDARFWQELAIKLPWNSTEEHKKMRIKQWS